MPVSRESVTTQAYRRVDLQEQQPRFRASLCFPEVKLDRPLRGPLVVSQLFYIGSVQVFLPTSLCENQKPVLSTLYINKEWRHTYYYLS